MICPIIGMLSVCPETLIPDISSPKVVTSVVVSAVVRVLMLESIKSVHVIIRGRQTEALYVMFQVIH